jgi:hypothetical protein
MLFQPALGQSEESEQAPVGRGVPSGPEALEEAETAESTVAVSVPVQAEYVISFQGYLEQNNSPANGQYDFIFRLRDFPTAGLIKWSEAQSNVQVTDGIYNVLLGSNNSLASVDLNDELWLAVEVEGQEILPRPKIAASPYSIMSLEALDVRLPAQISGTADVDGTKLLTITNNGTGDVLRVQGNSASDGIEVSGVDLNGIELLSVGQTAVVASGPGADGLYVSYAGDDGVDIFNVDDDGIVVSETGGYAFLFKDIPDDINGNLLTSYVGVIENTGNTTSEDVLAVKTGSGGNPGTAANLIGFFDDENDLIGQIEGNGSGGVAYNTSGSDYAEYLPHLAPGSRFEAGDVVGVVNGKISRQTNGAQQVMAITDRAAVLGNAPLDDENTSGYESVSFIGQVPVRVSGSVREGDYLVASGLNDGTALAVSPEDITLDQVDQLVGRAWESSESAGTKRINTVVGLDRTEVLSDIIRRQSARLDEQASAIEELYKLVNEFIGRHNGS